MNATLRGVLWMGGGNLRRDVLQPEPGAALKHQRGFLAWAAIASLSMAPFMPSTRSGEQRRSAP
jgi:hypothetical protein